MSKEKIAALEVIKDTEALEAYVKKAESSHERFSSMSDEEIVALAPSDESACEYILQKYKNLVRAKARSYYLIGADREDIVQEGMIGLYKAIRDYNADRRASFRAFAELCITRQIITAIKTATRQKHRPLNSYVSLDKPVFLEESERTLADMITAVRISNPEDIFIDKEGLSKMEKEIDAVLSPMEKQVLDLYLQGRSYEQIAKTVGRQLKSVDNALQRAKNKIVKCTAEQSKE